MRKEPKNASASIDSPDPHAHLERAYRLFGMDEHSDAIKECDAALRLDPNNSAALACRGSCKFKLELNTQALDDLDQAIVTDSSNFYAYRDRALCLAALGQHEKAILNFTLALELFLRSVLNNFAMNEPVNVVRKKTRFFPIGLLSLAKRGFDHYKEQSTIAGPGNPYDQPNSDQAPDSSSIDSNIVSDSPTSYLTMDLSLLTTRRGCSHVCLGQYQNALDDFNSAISQNPKNSSAYLNRAKYHTTLKAYKEALDDFNLAISLNPEDPEGYICRGEVKEKCGLDSQEDFLQASQLCMPALSQNRHIIHNRPNRVRPRILYYLARCCLHLNQTEHALSRMDDAITLEPNNVEYLSFRETCRSRLNLVGVSTKDQGDQETVATQASIEKRHDNAPDMNTSAQKMDNKFENNSASISSENKNVDSKKSGLPIAQLAVPSEGKTSQPNTSPGKDSASSLPTKESPAAIVKRLELPAVLTKSVDEKSTLSSNPADHTITIGIYGTVQLPANFLREQFGANYQDTTGRWTKRITVDGKTSDLVIYIDTQSDAKFAATFSIYPSNCDCIIVLVDASTSINRSTWHIYDAMHREDILSGRPLIFSGLECDPNKSTLWTVEDFTEMNRPCDFAYMIRPAVAGNLSNLFEVAARKTIALRANPRSFESRTAGKVDIIGVEAQPPKKSPKAAGISRPFFLDSSPEGRTSPFNKSGTRVPKTPSANAVSAPFAVTTASHDGTQSPLLKKGSRFAEKKLESSKESISISEVSSLQSTHSPVTKRGSRLGRRATESSTGSVPYTLLSSPRGLYDIPADYTIRIGVQGKKGCGKFRLIQQFCHGEDVNAEAVKNSNYEWKKRIRIDDKVCDLIIQRNVDLETCDCVIILADVKAFLDRETWVYFDSLYQNQAEALNSRPLIFAGTKHENSVGELWSMYDFVRMNKPCDYAVMTSAENNVNVAELFVTAARKTMELKLHPQAFYERHPQMPEYAHPDSAQDTYSPVNWRGH